MKNSTTKIAEKRALLIEQKRQLILTDDIKAFWKYIDTTNQQVYSDLMRMMEDCLEEVAGCYQNKNSRIAQKHVLLAMLKRNLL